MKDAHGNPALKQLLSTLEAAAKLRETQKAAFFSPYPKQIAFFDNGAVMRERLLMAGNQLGKSEAGAYETYCHLTGDYPDWWLGRRFEEPTKGWVAGETGTVVRDTPQWKLCGPPGVEEKFGTGMIPRERFVGRPSMARGVTDAYDTIHVRHKSGGISTASFKSYEQGRKKFQAATLNWVWMDEEPPLDVYSECLTRVTATNGIVWITFTPLQGRSDVVIRYLDDKSRDRGVTTMTIEDALHIPAEERQRIIDGYPAHEREARVHGIPMLGSGRIFPYAEESISEDRIEVVPVEWAKIWGIDFGVEHPFGAALLAWDKDTDIIHLIHTVRMADAYPINHAAAMKPIGADVPVAWPHDGTQREKGGSGDQVHQHYKKEGLRMLPDHATWPEGGLSTEAAVLELQTRMTTGRFKVAKHLTDFWEEYRFYHRKDGLIVKKKDDLISAVYKGLMMKRFAKPVALGSKRPPREQGGLATGVDFDMF